MGRHWVAYGQESEATPHGTSEYIAGYGEHATTRTKQGLLRSKTDPAGGTVSVTPSANNLGEYHKKVTITGSSSGSSTQRSQTKRPLLSGESQGRKIPRGLKHSR